MAKELLLCGAELDGAGWKGWCWRKSEQDYIVAFGGTAKKVGVGLHGDRQKTVKRRRPV